MSSEEPRKHWRKLTPEQAEIAQAILERAVDLYEQIEELGLPEALDIAAGEVGRGRVRAAQERARELS
ncbi:hypothetical protein P3T35_003031 [Kitasatospora sp. GP30]|uniref:hypothetical protein n=1 Tax=Kitasatospora sp. GP30 TaxID=3035084 RepID=UPI000C70A4C5|nr:hypothetical protein [Kitasatospora sp. GP30]MDH6141018.1 hypothetical protein [Kitasatospora sp. GP30]